MLGGFSLTIDRLISMNSDGVSYQLQSQLIDTHATVRDSTENALWYRMMLFDNDQNILRTVLLHIKLRILDGHYD